MYAQIYMQINLTTIFQKKNFFVKAYMNLQFCIDITKLPA